MSAPPDVLLREVIAELDGALTAIADALRAKQETPVNQERVGVDIDQIEAARDALREMREQEVTECQ